MVLSCNHESKIENYSSETLKIERINDNIYKHVSYVDTEDYGKVACNGMLFIDHNKAIIYDTPVNDSVSNELIQLVSKNHDITAIVVTHFHSDCLGGLDEFHRQGITSYSSTKTIELAAKNNYSIPQNGFDEILELKIGNQIAKTQFFGEGHTPDNVVGYIPSENALFGGCLIKSINASKGNLEDANTSHWTQTVENIKTKYPNLEIVIPGHGKAGGKSLLDYTSNLFKTN